MFGKLKDITCSINKISLERRYSFHECLRRCTSLNSKASIPAPRSFHSFPVVRPSSTIRGISTIKSNPQCSFAPPKYCQHQNNTAYEKLNSKLLGILGENCILVSRRDVHDWKNEAIKRGSLKKPKTEINVFSFHTDNRLNMKQNITNGKDTMTVSDRIYRKDLENASLLGSQSRELNGIRHKKFQSNSTARENSTQKVWNSKSFDSNSKVTHDLTKFGESFEKRDENTTIQNKISQIQDIAEFSPPNKMLSNLNVYEKQQSPKNYLSEKNLYQSNTKSQQQVFDTNANKFPKTTVFSQTTKEGTFTVNRKSIQLSDDSQLSNLSKTLDLGQSGSQRKKTDFVDLRHINAVNTNIPSRGGNFAGARLKVSPQYSPRNYRNRNEPTTINRSPPTKPPTTAGQSQAQTVNEIMKSNHDECERESLRDENNEIRHFPPTNNFYGKTRKYATKRQWIDKNDVEEVLSAMLRKNNRKQMYVDYSGKIQYPKNRRAEVPISSKNDTMRGERKKQLMNYVLKPAGRYADSKLTFSHKSLCLTDIERYKHTKLLERHRAMKTIYDAHWQWDKAGSTEVFDKPLITRSDVKRTKSFKLRPADIAEKIRLKAKIVNSKELIDETIKPQLYCKDSLALGMAQMPIAPCTRVVNRQRGHSVRKEPKTTRTDQMTKSITKRRALGSFFKNSNPLWMNQRMLSNQGDHSQRNIPKGKPKIDIKGALKYLLDFKTRLRMSRD